MGPVKITITIVVLATLVGLLAGVPSGCSKEAGTKGLTPLSVPRPAGFPEPVSWYRDNPVTQEGFELGRRLFYDGRLSIDNMHPCSSCHQQIAGFGTFEHDRSHGVFDSHTLRNAPVLFNVIWNRSFHLDSAFSSPEIAIEQPITGAVEMGESWEGVITKLESDAAYREQFKKVFGSPFIRPVHVLKAISQYLSQIVSAGSKYDRVKQGQASFTPEELNGYQVYRTYCAGCHPEPLFTDHSYRNIGLPLDPLLNDKGMMRVTGRRGDSLRFRVPTLRNLYISSNYMHDGRFNTPGQCIEHYRSGVQAGPTLDPALAGGLPLTNTEVSHLLRFLRTLTDSSVLSDPRLGRP